MSRLTHRWAPSAVVVLLSAMAANADVFQASSGHSFAWGAGADIVDYYKLPTEDGIAENSIGFGAPGTVAYANKFTVDAGGQTITDISLVWGMDSNPNVPHTFAIWKSGGTLTGMALASTPVTVPGGAAGGTATIDIPDVTFNVGDEVYIGFLAQGGPTSFFGAWDSSAPHSGQSFIWGTPSAGAFGVSNIGSAAAVGEVGGFGLAGDWLIRANAVPTPGALGLLAAGGALAARRRR